jgi:hypothetical protein
MTVASEQQVIRVVTFPKPQEPPQCDGSYTCACAPCVADRERAVARDVRRRCKPVPLLRRRAA